LPQALDVRYTVLEGKFAGSTMYGGRVVKRATRTAELRVDQPVAAFSNLKLHLLRPTGEVVPGELFAKVVETRPEDASRVVVRFRFTTAPAHFDVHQQGATLVQLCMYDNLVRRDPRDSGQTIIPDLAHSWEIAKDGKTYTFFLRKGVKFHDGGTLTAADVQATYARLITPPTGFSSPRTPLFSAVSEINVRDPYTIEFQLSEARPKSFMLGAFASGWNIIVRKKTLEDNNYNLRQVMNYPGTGPFRHVKRVDKEVWVMERNPDYWNEGQ